MDSACKLAEFMMLINWNQSWNGLNQTSTLCVSWLLSPQVLHLSFWGQHPIQSKRPSWFSWSSVCTQERSTSSSVLDQASKSFLRNSLVLSGSLKLHFRRVNFIDSHHWEHKVIRKEFSNAAVYQLLPKASPAVPTTLWLLSK